MGMFLNAEWMLGIFSFHYLKRVLICTFSLFLSNQTYSELRPVSDYEMSLATAQAELPFLPALEDLGFQVQGGGIELDLDVQSSIESIEWADSDGATGNEESAGSLYLKGVHIGSASSAITAEQVRSNQPFAESDLAMIHGLIIEADPQKGTLITLNKLGDSNGDGIDIIVNDIYFGRDLTSEGQRGLGLLVEDLTNFISDDVLSSMNQTFSKTLATIDDGMNTPGGNYYPIKLAIQPLEGGASQSTINEDLTSQLGEVIALPGLTDTSMRIDGEFLVYMDKLAVYHEDWEAGIKGLMIYQGVDSNNDGVEDLIAPVQIKDFTLQTIDHQLADGSHVKAINIPNIDINMDIAMQNIYIGNPDTGSLGAIHINDLHIHDTQLWIYPH